MRLLFLCLLCTSTHGYEDALSHTDLKGVRAPGVCGDDLATCAEWAVAGACDDNGDFMDLRCRLSCAQCACAEVLDLQDECQGWAASGECEANALFMRRQCRRSCSVCDVDARSGKDEL